MEKSENSNWLSDRKSTIPQVQSQPIFYRNTVIQEVREISLRSGKKSG